MNIQMNQINGLQHPKKEELFAKTNINCDNNVLHMLSQTNSSLNESYVLNNSEKMSQLLSNWNIEDMLQGLSENSSLQINCEDCAMGVPSIDQKQKKYLILFFDKLPTLLNRIYAGTIQEKQIYYINHPVLSSIDRQYLLRNIHDINKPRQIQQFFQKNKLNYQLIPIKISTNGPKVFNRASLIHLFKLKYFQNNNLVLWKIKDILNTEQLLNDFEQMQITVKQLNKQTLLLHNKNSSKEDIKYINIERQEKYVQKFTNQLEISKSIIPVKPIILNINEFNRFKAQNINSFSYFFSMLDKLQKEEQLFAVPLIQYQNDLNFNVSLQFVRQQDLLNFIQIAYKNNFQYLIKFSYNNRQQTSPLIIEDMDRLKGQHLDYQQLQQALRSHKNIQSKEKCKQDQESVKNILMIINQYLRKNNIYAIFDVWKKDLRKFIEGLIINWQVYNVDIRGQLIMLTRLIQYYLQKFKIQNISLYSYVYSDIDQLVNKLLAILNIQKLRNCQNFIKKKGNDTTGDCSSTIKASDLVECKEALNIQKNESITEKVLQHYITYKQGNNKGEPFMIKIQKKKQNLSQFISERMGIDKQFGYLRDLLQFINYSFREQQISKNNPKQIEIYNKRNNYFQNIEEERIVDTHCLGCSSFLYLGMNILDETVFPSQMRAFSSVQKMKEFQSQIKDEICAMLNSNGGVIIFDCPGYYQKFHVKGIKMNEKQKQQYQQRFMSYMDVFQPKIEAKRCIKISFVPVMADPYQEGQYQKQSVYQTYVGEELLYKKYQKYKKRPFIQNLYVMRVRVSPFDGTMAFYWNQNNEKQQKYQNKSLMCTIMRSGVKHSLKLGKISKLIKQKMKRYYIPQTLSILEKQFRKIPFTYFNHECRDPEAGVGFQTTQKDMQLAQTCHQQMLPQKDFQYTSLLIAKKSTLVEIKNKFQSENIQCRIDCKYQNLGFKSVKNTAVMYHNKKFQQVLNTILSNPKFIINGKMLLVISVTNYIKLYNRNQNAPYCQTELTNLRGWLFTQFPQEQLKLFQFQSGSKTKQYYLQTESYDSTLFIYYILNNYGQKAVFKNPLHLDKMSWQEKSTKFRQLFPIKENYKNSISDNTQDSHNRNSESIGPNSTFEDSIQSKNIVNFKQKQFNTFNQGYQKNIIQKQEKTLNNTNDDSMKFQQNVQPYKDGKIHVKGGGNNGLSSELLIINEKSFKRNGQRQISINGL